MPVKATKKTVSQKKRKEIREAARSIPGLIIEHVSFDQNNSQDNNETPGHNKKYMLSDAKRREHQKKKNTMLIGVGIVVAVLIGLWLVNMKSFFFDSKHSISSEEALLNSIRNDYNSTIGLLEERPKVVSSTLENIRQEELQKENLKAALLAGLLATSSTTSTETTSTNTTTTSTIETNDFPTSKTVTNTNTNSIP